MQALTDHQIVESALNEADKNHHHAWMLILTMIETTPMYQSWRRRFRNSEHVSEDAPDLQAYVRLKKNLTQFRFESKLNTYVRRVTSNAVLEWYRAQFAMKRRGQYDYMSRAIAHDELFEDVLASNVNVETLVDQSMLACYLQQAINQSMANDAQLDLIRNVWKPLIYDMESPTLLATKLNMQPRDLFNLRNRIIRHIRPALRYWFE